LRVAVTGGTGFVGGQLIAALAAAGHQVVSVARGKRPTASASVVNIQASVTEKEKLPEAFAGCAEIVHLAGINRDVGCQTFEAVHVEGTRNVVAAARSADAEKVVLLSFLKARPDCGSRYHETKWEAERIVAESGLDFTILKAGIIYGRGDGMLTNLHRALRLLPVFAPVGLREATVRPVAVGDVVSILVASAVEGRLSGEVVPVLGPEELPLSAVVRRVAQVMNRRVLVVPLPVWFHRLQAWLGEKLLADPLVSGAQVRMLAEGVSDPLPGCDELPPDLQPRTALDQQAILAALPRR